MCRHDRLEVAPIAGFIGYPSKPAYVPGTSLGSLYDMQIRVPNIRGEGDWVYGGYASKGKFTGAMYHVSLQNSCGATGGEDYYLGKPGIGIDASRSSSTYGNASTVQPSSVRLILCVKA